MNSGVLPHGVQSCASHVDFKFKQDAPGNAGTVHGQTRGQGLHASGRR